MSSIRKVSTAVRRAIYSGAGKGTDAYSWVQLKRVCGLFHGISKHKERR